MLAYVSSQYGVPANFFYGIGIAPYINLGGQQNTAGLTTDQVLNALTASVNGLKTGTGLSNAKSIATNYGLKLEAYEGGIDTFGDQSVAAKKAASLDPRIEGDLTSYFSPDGEG